MGLSIFGFFFGIIGILLILFSIFTLLSYYVENEEHKKKWEKWAVISATSTLLIVGFGILAILSLPMFI